MRNNSSRKYLLKIEKKKMLLWDLENDPTSKIHTGYYTSLYLLHKPAMRALLYKKEKFYLKELWFFMHILLIYLNHVSDTIYSLCPINIISLFIFGLIYNFFLRWGEWLQWPKWHHLIQESMHGGPLVQWCLSLADLPGIWFAPIALTAPSSGQTSKIT